MLKNEVSFDIYKDLERVNANSLLIDNGEEVASLQVGKIYLSLMCRGEVTVNYKEESYKSASEYPQIVTDYLLGRIEDKKLLEQLDEEIWVGDNNWFEIEVCIVKGNNTEPSGFNYTELESVNVINDYADVFDIEGCLEHNELSRSVMLYNILLGHLKDLKEKFQDEVKELKDLDLSNL